jgi:hypothetical protein
MQRASVNGGLIILNNLDSGSHTLKVYNHDGVHLMKFQVLIFMSFSHGFFFWMILMYVVVIASVSFVYYRWNKMRYIQNSNFEEELKHQKKILEID